MYSERNEGFSLRDIFIQLLFIVLFIFILVCLFPTKASVNSRFADIDRKLDALTSGIFNTNLQTMKDAAVSYYTTERLPEKVNDVKSMTLKEMIKNKLLVEFTDGNGNSCDLTKSYVEVVKLENEYQMKINLSCTDNDAYIIVHLGCYDYCEAAGVCEKKETPVVKENPPIKVDPPVVKTCKYEYKKVTNGSWGDYGNWSSWSTTKVTETDYRKVESKKETVITGTKKVVDYYRTEQIDATPATYSYCPSGYDDINGTCTKKVSAYYYSKCPTGYTFNNGLCYGTKTTTQKTSLICEDKSYTLSGTKCVKNVSSQVTVTPSCPDSSYTLSGNNCIKGGSNSTATPKCPDSSYTLSGNTCVKEVTTGCKTTYSKGDYVATKTGSSVPANNKTYYYETVSSKTVLSCDGDCKNTIVYTYNVYKTIVSTTGCKTTTETATPSCPDSSYKLTNGVCVKTGTSTSVTASCPDKTYTLSNGKCIKPTSSQDVKDSTCPSGFVKNSDGSACLKSTGETITKEPTCPTGYTINSTKDKCYGTATVTTNRQTTTTYSCPTNQGYTLSGTKCVKTVPVYKTVEITDTVIYYRSKERKYISGTVDTKWSNSENDTTLINQGYSLTGAKSCS